MEQSIGVSKYMEPSSLDLVKKAVRRPQKNGGRTRTVNEILILVEIPQSPLKLCPPGGSHSSSLDTSQAVAITNHQAPAASPPLETPQAVVITNPQAPAASPPLETPQAVVITNPQALAMSPPLLKTRKPWPSQTIRHLPYLLLLKHLQAVAITNPQALAMSPPLLKNRKPWPSQTIRRLPYFLHS
ncbi:hypothetical protein BU16DRAFT_561696 [Lophium mytilinum]|uniref:Uncharacterized protein n=1 Tax=Lophium mytilinum TaxID=390894 RepID=A0A6A6QWP4_9PEZI|nr:hypothetical protein BU16DRAFT_561696 [Lophium mytilinum]